MNRRSFLTALALSPVALVCAKEKPKLTVAMIRKNIAENPEVYAETVDDFHCQDKCMPKPSSFWGELDESRSFIYCGYYFTVQHVSDSELEYIALHPFFEIQGIEAMFILTEQLEELKRRNMFLDGMIRRWRKKQVYTTEELRGF